MVSSVASEKFPVTPLGIDPETLRLVAQCLNHYATTGPNSNGVVGEIKQLDGWQMFKCVIAHLICLSAAFHRTLQTQNKGPSAQYCTVLHSCTVQEGHPHRCRKAIYTKEISPSVPGLQVTHAVHGLTKILVFATHVPTLTPARIAVTAFFRNGLHRAGKNGAHFSLLCDKKKASG
jgi:hypothetical protein